MTVSNNYNDGRFSVDHYSFPFGGDGDTKFCNFISDAAQGFKVPAKSLSIENHGGGQGDNYLYYTTIHAMLGKSRQKRLLPDGFVNYMLGETRIWGIILWGSNANLEFSLDATPGEWTDLEVQKFVTSPIVKRNISYLEKIPQLDAGLVL
jgi:hypothetical protein